MFDVFVLILESVILYAFLVVSVCFKSGYLVEYEDVFSFSFRFVFLVR